MYFSPPPPPAARTLSRRPSLAIGTVAARQPLQQPTPIQPTTLALGLELAFTTKAIEQKEKQILSPRLRLNANNAAATTVAIPEVDTSASAASATVASVNPRRRSIGVEGLDGALITGRVELVAPMLDRFSSQPTRRRLSMPAANLLTAPLTPAASASSGVASSSAIEASAAASVSSTTNLSVAPVSPVDSSSTYSPRNLDPSLSHSTILRTRRAYPNYLSAKPKDLWSSSSAAASAAALIAAEEEQKREPRLRRRGSLAVSQSASLSSTLNSTISDPNSNSRSHRSSIGGFGSTVDRWSGAIGSDSDTGTSHHGSSPQMKNRSPQHRRGTITTRRTIIANTDREETNNESETIQSEQYEGEEDENDQPVDGDRIRRASVDVDPNASLSPTRLGGAFSSLPDSASSPPPFVPVVDLMTPRDSTSSPRVESRHESPTSQHRTLNGENIANDEEKNENIESNRQSNVSSTVANSMRLSASSSTVGLINSRVGSAISSPVASVSSSRSQPAIGSNQKRSSLGESGSVAYASSNTTKLFASGLSDEHLASIDTEYAHLLNLPPSLQRQARVAQRRHELEARARSDLDRMLDEQREKEAIAEKDRMARINAKRRALTKGARVEMTIGPGVTLVEGSDVDGKTFMTEAMFNSMQEEKSVDQLFPFERTPYSVQSIPYLLQGNPSLNKKVPLTQRLKLERHPLIRDRISDYWKVFEQTLPPNQQVRENKNLNNSEEVKVVTHNTTTTIQTNLVESSRHTSGTMKRTPSNGVVASLEADRISSLVLSRSQYINLHMCMSKALHEVWSLKGAQQLAELEWKKDIIAASAGTNQLSHPTAVSQRKHRTDDVKDHHATLISSLSLKELKHGARKDLSAKDLLALKHKSTHDLGRGSARTNNVDSANDSDPTLIATLSKVGFFHSLFEVTDIWTEGIESEEYVGFLQLLFTRLTKSNPYFIDDANQRARIRKPKLPPGSNPLLYKSPVVWRELHEVQRYKRPIHLPTGGYYKVLLIQKWWRQWWQVKQEHMARRIQLAWRKWLPYIRRRRYQVDKAACKLQRFMRRRWARQRIRAIPVEELHARRRQALLERMLERSHEIDDEDDGNEEEDEDIVSTVSSDPPLSSDEGGDDSIASSSVTSRSWTPDPNLAQPDANVSHLTLKALRDKLTHESDVDAQSRDMELLIWACRKLQKFWRGSMLKKRENERFQARIAHRRAAILAGREKAVSREGRRKGRAAAYVANLALLRMLEEAHIDTNSRPATKEAAHEEGHNTAGQTAPSGDAEPHTGATEHVSPRGIFPIDLLKEPPGVPPPAAVVTPLVDLPRPAPPPPKPQRPPPPPPIVYTQFPILLTPPTIKALRHFLYVRRSRHPFTPLSGPAVIARFLYALFAHIRVRHCKIHHELDVRLGAVRRRLRKLEKDEGHKGLAKLMRGFSEEQDAAGAAGAGTKLDKQTTIPTSTPTTIINNGEVPPASNSPALPPSLTRIGSIRPGGRDSSQGSSSPASIGLKRPSLSKKSSFGMLDEQHDESSDATGMSFGVGRSTVPRHVRLGGDMELPTTLSQAVAQLSTIESEPLSSLAFLEGELFHRSKVEWPKLPHLVLACVEHWPFEWPPWRGPRDVATNDAGQHRSSHKRLDSLMVPAGAHKRAGSHGTNVEDLFVVSGVGEGESHTHHPHHQRSKSSSSTTHKSSKMRQLAASKAKELTSRRQKSEEEVEAEQVSNSIIGKKTRNTSKVGKKKTKKSTTMKTKHKHSASVSSSGQVSEVNSSDSESCTSSSASSDADARSSHGHHLQLPKPANPRSKKSKLRAKLAKKRHAATKKDDDASVASEASGSSPSESEEEEDPGVVAARAAADLAHQQAAHAARKARRKARHARADAKRDRKIARRMELIAQGVTPEDAAARILTSSEESMSDSDKSNWGGANGSEESLSSDSDLEKLLTNTMDVDDDACVSPAAVVVVDSSAPVDPTISVVGDAVAVSPDAHVDLPTPDVRSIRNIILKLTQSNDTHTTTINTNTNDNNNDTNKEEHANANPKGSISLLSSTEKAELAAYIAALKAKQAATTAMQSEHAPAPDHPNVAIDPLNGAIDSRTAHPSGPIDPSGAHGVGDPSNSASVDDSSSTLSTAAPAVLADDEVIRLLTDDIDVWHSDGGLNGGLNADALTLQHLGDVMSKIFRNQNAGRFNLADANRIQAERRASMMRGATNNDGANGGASMSAAPSDMVHTSSSPSGNSNGGPQSGSHSVAHRSSSLMVGTNSSVDTRISMARGDVDGAGVGNAVSGRSNVDPATATMEVQKMTQHEATGKRVAKATTGSHTNNSTTSTAAVSAVGSVASNVTDVGVNPLSRRIRQRRSFDKNSRFISTVQHWRAGGNTDVLRPKLEYTMEMEQERQTTHQKERTRPESPATIRARRKERYARAEARRQQRLQSLVSPSAGILASMERTYHKLYDSSSGRRVGMVDSHSMTSLHVRRRSSAVDEFPPSGSLSDGAASDAYPHSKRTNPFKRAQTNMTHSEEDGGRDELEGSTYTRSIRPYLSSDDGFDTDGNTSLVQRRAPRLATIAAPMSHGDTLGPLMLINSSSAVRLTLPFDHVAIRRVPTLKHRPSNRRSTHASVAATGVDGVGIIGVGVDLGVGSGGVLSGLSDIDDYTRGVPLSDDGGVSDHTMKYRTRKVHPMTNIPLNIEQSVKQAGHTEQATLAGSSGTAGDEQSAATIATATHRQPARIDIGTESKLAPPPAAHMTAVYAAAGTKHATRSHPGRQVPGDDSIPVDASTTNLVPDPSAPASAADGHHAESDLRPASSSTVPSSVVASSRVLTPSKPDRPPSAGHSGRKARATLIQASPEKKTNGIPTDNHHSDVTPSKPVSVTSPIVSPLPPLLFVKPIAATSQSARTHSNHPDLRARSHLKSTDDLHTLRAAASAKESARALERARRSQQIRARIEREELKQTGGGAATTVAHTNVAQFIRDPKTGQLYQLVPEEIKFPPLAASTSVNTRAPRRRRHRSHVRYQPHGRAPRSESDASFSDAELQLRARSSYPRVGVNNGGADAHIDVSGTDYDTDGYRSDRRQRLDGAGVTRPNREKKAIRAPMLPSFTSTHDNQAYVVDIDESALAKLSVDKLLLPTMQQGKLHRGVMRRPPRAHHHPSSHSSLPPSKSFFGVLDSDARGESSRRPPIGLVRVGSTHTRTMAVDTHMTRRDDIDLTRQQFHTPAIEEFLAIRTKHDETQQQQHQQQQSYHRTDEGKLESHVDDVGSTSSLPIAPIATSGVSLHPNANESSMNSSLRSRTNLDDPILTYRSSIDSTHLSNDLLIISPHSLPLTRTHHKATPATIAAAKLSYARNMTTNPTKPATTSPDADVTGRTDAHAGGGE